MCMEKTPWEKAVEFHGHACPGLAIGFKSSEAALQVLGPTRDIDEEIVAIAENDSCAVDAIQSVLGCTIGKGNLTLRNYGKQVFTIGSRKNGQAVRISLKFDIMGGRDSGESKAERTQRILNTDVNGLFDIKKVDFDFPKRAVILKSLKCTQCGEGVMESKARIKDGAIVCPDCCEDSGRRW